MDYGTKDVIRGLLWANLIAGFILYVTYYRQLEGALALLRDIAPPLMFIAGAILIASHDHSVIRRRRIHGEEQEHIFITYWDALVCDVLAFLAAAAVLALPGLLSANGVTVVDLLQAGVVFAAITFIRNYFFDKIGR